MPTFADGPQSEDPRAEAMPPFSRWLSLDKYLRSIRSFVGGAGSGGDHSSKVSPTFVIGNPSADLDSFVSAVIYSYFHNHSELLPQHTKHAKGGANSIYIPLLNLPNTPSSALHRLRPEFDLAVRSAAAWHVGDEGLIEGNGGSNILDQVITIHDLTTTFSSSPLALAFNPTSSSKTAVPVVLVDHNVPCIIGLTPDELSSRFTVTGCIDHHVDESSSPQSYSPRIIDLNAGSCTSLVVSYLRSQHLFPDPNPNPQPNSSELSATIALQQISSLALSSILIDTGNLKSSSKTKPVDIETVQFLTSHLTKPLVHDALFTPPKAKEPLSTSAVPTFFAEDYHRMLSDAKVHSLEKLNAEEILDRDYKQWTEPLNHNHNSSSSSSRSSSTAEGAKFVEIGISSAPQPISWLVDHASGGNGNSGGASNFVSAITKFSKAHNLDIYLLLTRPTPHGKGLAAIAFTDVGLNTLKKFEKRGIDVLGLKPYGDDGDQQQQQELNQAIKSEFGDGGANGEGGRWRIWWLTKLQNTRKQIAPLVRECVNG